MKCCAPMSCYQWHDMLKWFCAHDQGNDGVFIHAEFSSVCFIRVKVPARKLFFPAKSQKDASGIDDTSLLFNMECDADIHKNSYANSVPSGGTAS